MADLLRKYMSRYSSTSNSFSTGSGVTITPNSVVGLPTTTEITLTFDRVDAAGTATPTKIESIIGSISGGNFVTRTSPASGRGADGTTEQAHTSPVVEMIWNSKDWNDSVDAFLVGHTQAGAHGTISACTVTASTITASNAVIGDAVTASRVTASQVTATQTLNACNVVVSAVTANSITARTTNGDLTEAANGTGKIVRSSAVNDTIYDNGNSGSAVTLSWANGSTQKLTLTGSCTLTYSNVKAGDYLNLWVVQGGSGSYSLTYPATTYHTASTATALSTAVGSNDWRGIRATASNVYHVVANANALG